MAAQRPDFDRQWSVPGSNRWPPACKLGSGVAWGRVKSPTAGSCAPGHLGHRRWAPRVATARFHAGSNPVRDRLL